MTRQTSTIRILLTRTFQEVEVDVILTNAFPDVVERDKLIKTAMRKVAKEGGVEYRDVHRRLKEDANYATVLSYPVSCSTHLHVHGNGFIL